MSNDGVAKPRPRGGLVDKRRSILAGALSVFARDGYVRASIDAISSAAGVSTRTIYNHFQDKEELFRTVIQESATQVAEVQIEVIDRHLSTVADLEASLLAFGRAWAEPMTNYAEHIALVRQVNAETGHIPQAAIDAWQRTGPLRVRRELAYRLRRLADRGLLRVDDSERAALHLMLLISVSNPVQHSFAPTDAELQEMVAAGVDTFLNGRRNRDAPAETHS
ncbi:TetR/AcrR family transcriptional regulator [Actinokineospora sp. G85]|uniref:TetR/AcrR family transcriptional regulator n=1 Tax=Actinokineospora sp. G85 TaxID=3406626 RepID=UPI003C706C08